MVSARIMPRRRTTAVVCALLLAALTALLAACAPTSHDHQQRPHSNEHDTRPLVLATFSVIADIAQQVAGEHLRVEALVQPGTEIHGYEPTPGDLRRAADAVLILDNGMGLEAWFEQFVHGLDVPHVVVSEGVEAIDIADDAYAGMPNPHAWMSALNAQRYAQNMAEAFTDLDPSNAAAYERNASYYSGQLQRVHEKLIAELQSLPREHRALVTCEGAFSYLARDAGLEEVYIWPVNAEQQATPRRIAAVIDFVDEHRVPAVFCESTVSDAPMQRVVESSDSAFGGVLYVDSLSEPDGPVPSYLDLLRHNATTIISGLAGGQS